MHPLQIIDDSNDNFLKPYIIRCCYK